MTVPWYIVILRRTVAARWLHYGVNEFLWVSFKRQIMSYILNFVVVENLLILTYDLGSTDQTLSDSPCHVMWVVWLEVTCMPFSQTFTFFFVTEMQHVFCAA
jgi:hypothetical protein